MKAEPYEFDETWCNDRVSDVDYNGENGLTLHMMVWPVERIECLDVERRTPTILMKVGVLVEFHA